MVKKGQTGAEITFDASHRNKFLTGFHARRQERIKKAKDKQEEDKKQEKKDIKTEYRSQVMTQWHEMQRHKALVEKMIGGDKGEASSSSAGEAQKQAEGEDEPKVEDFDEEGDDDVFGGCTVTTDLNFGEGNPLWPAPIYTPPQSSRPNAFGGWGLFEANNDYAEEDEKKPKQGKKEKRRDEFGRLKAPKTDTLHQSKRREMLLTKKGKDGKLKKTNKLLICKEVKASL